MHSRSHRSSSIRRSSSPFPANDPLGVLESTASVIQQATFVTIDQGAIARLADDLMAMRAIPPAWDSTLHFRDLTPTGAPKTAGWVLVLDALNFCFWAQGWVQGDDPDFRWRVEWQGTTHDGYAALAAALSRAVEEGIPVWDADWLMQITANELHHILRPVAGCPEIPLFDARLAHLHELGTGLHAIRTKHLDSDPVAHLIQHARGSAVELVREVVARFPSFDDVSVWIDAENGQEREIRFFKRAQILIADLAGALDGKSLGYFHDLAALTAFADYKVPQVLRQLGILGYTSDLTARIQRRELIAAGSREEIEIRAATVQACDRIQQALTSCSPDSPPFTATEIDWLLWNRGQSLPKGSEPYHRTVTIFY